MKLTEHFHMEEVTVSNHRDIPNKLPPDLYENVYNTASQMEAVRTLLDSKPISVSSWYRSPGLNAFVGGAKSSQHMKGEAVDFICPDFGTPYQIVQRLSQYKDKLRIDQIINEHTWVHISFVIPPRVPRLEVLTYVPKYKSYVQGLKLLKEVQNG